MHLTHEGIHTHTPTNACKDTKQITTQYPRVNTVFHEHIGLKQGEFLGPLYTYPSYLVPVWNGVNKDANNLFKRIKSIDRNLIKLVEQAILGCCWLSASVSEALWGIYTRMDSFGLAMQFSSYAPCQCLRCEHRTQSTFRKHHVIFFPEFMNNTGLWYRPRGAQDETAVPSSYSLSVLSQSKRSSHLLSKLLLIYIPQTFYFYNNISSFSDNFFRISTNK